MFDSTAASVIGRRVGNYVIQRALAQGGMGAVFLARHPALGREVAVKFLGDELEDATEFNKRFLDEARITAGLRHANIVDIFDFGELDGRPYYVMELLKGRDLSDVMHARGQFTGTETLDAVEQICRGLSAAHAVGVVHRDLKPGNVFVMQGESLHLKLMDFGVAKILSASEECTRHGQVIGTPRYMSPEQALGQVDRIGTQSDIYSLGIIAYEMLAGRTPFEHSLPVMLLVMQVRDSAPPLRSHVPSLPLHLADLVHACLEKEPRNRPASVDGILGEVSTIRQSLAETEDAAMARALFKRAFDRACCVNVLNTGQLSNSSIADASTCPPASARSYASLPVRAVLQILSEPCPAQLSDSESQSEANDLGSDAPNRLYFQGIRSPLSVDSTGVGTTPSQSSDGESYGGEPCQAIGFDETLAAAPALPLHLAVPAATRAQLLDRSQTDLTGLALAPTRAPSKSVAPSISTHEPSPAGEHVAHPTASSAPVVDSIQDAGMSSTIATVLATPVLAATPPADLSPTPSGDSDSTSVSGHTTATPDSAPEVPTAGAGLTVQNAPDARRTDSQAEILQSASFGTSVLLKTDSGAPTETPEAHPSDVALEVDSRILSLEPGREDCRTPHRVQLSDSDRNTMNRLLMRMQTRRDFPAFIQHVNEVTKRADCDGAYSAQQLSNSILKDYALTAKLLRIVNSTYARRFGGKVYSVQHAILILGFERIRAMAVSTSLFKSRGNGDQDSRVAESTVNSLVASEIAGRLHRQAKVDDPEQAVVCAMFRNLGKHLVLVYLPELYDQILAVAARERISLNQASGRVLGLSFRKLGIGIAQRWNLPSNVIATLSIVPKRTGTPTSDPERLAALADFSNRLCEIVSSAASPEVRSAATQSLVRQYGSRLQIPGEDLAAVVAFAQQSAEQRYCSLFGLTIRSAHQPRCVTTSKMEVASTPSRVQRVAARAGGTQTQGEDANRSPQDGAPRDTNEHILTRRTTVQTRVMPLQLGRVLDAPEDSTDSAKLERALLEETHTEVITHLEQGGSAERAMYRLLDALARYLHVPRILLTRATSSRRELVVVGGIGEDIDGIGRALRFPLASARAASDPLSLAYHSGHDFYFDDVFAPHVTRWLPQCYYEVVGSTCLAVLASGARSGHPLVLFMDLDPPHQLPSREHVEVTADVRAVLAGIAPMMAPELPQTSLLTQKARTKAL